MIYSLTERVESEHGVYEKEIAKFTTEEKFRTFWEKHIEPAANNKKFRYFLLDEHVPTNPETLADVNNYDYKKHCNWC